MKAREIQTGELRALHRVRSFEPRKVSVWLGMPVVLGIALQACGSTGSNETVPIPQLDLGGRLQLPPEVVGGAAGSGGVMSAPPVTGPAGGGGAAGAGGEAGAGGAAGSPPMALTCFVENTAPSPVSMLCGDGLRDVNTEECDAGPAGNAACSSQCRTVDFPLAPLADPSSPRPIRDLGRGRHPAALGCNGFGLTMVDSTSDSSPFVSALSLGRNGELIGAPMRVTFGANPRIEADPVIAGLPDGSYVVAWNDLTADGDQLGIAMRNVDFTKRFLGDVVVANDAKAFSQQDPDLIWSGKELVVAWTDTSSPQNGQDVWVRRFSSDLQPLGADEPLGTTSAVEGNVSLATFQDGWAAAWRSITLGRESIAVRVGGKTFSIGEFSPGATKDRPALLQIDAQRLLVVFSVGTDPLMSGTSNVPRLSASVVDVSGPLNPPFALVNSEGASVNLGESQPALVRVGQQAFLAWHSGTNGGAAAEDLWLQGVTWDATLLTLSFSTPMQLPRDTLHQSGDQRTPMLVGSEYWANDRLFAAWTDYGFGFPAESGQPRVVGQLMRLPILRLPPIQGLL